MFKNTWLTALNRRRRPYVHAPSLPASRAWLAGALDALADAVITTDSRGAINYMNAAACSLTGWDAARAAGRPCEVVLAVQRAEDPAGAGIAGPLTTALAGERFALRSGLLLARRGGGDVRVEGHAAPVLDAAGAVSGAVFIMRDQSEASMLSARLAHQTRHDGLTGLGNRHQFVCQLEAAVSQARARQQVHAMLYLDLDRFNLINDSCGHAAGDSLLRRVAAALQAVLPHAAAVARIGGDQFGVALSDCTEAAATRAAAKLCEVVRNMRHEGRGGVFAASASIGVTRFGDGDSVDDILRRTDVACATAKDKGGDQACLYAPDDGELIRRQHDIDWAGRIRRALEDDSFTLYAQEIRHLSVTAPATAHFEILLRMLDAGGAVIGPGQFIPAAERYGLMPLIDRWVIRQAFRTLAPRNPTHRPPQELCAINLSGCSLGDPALLAYICDEFARSGLSPRAVCFEITETAAISSLRHATALIRQLSAMGCRFALDDFGSGMASFSYLKQLRVDYLKIDGSFVKGMAADAADLAMVQTINQIGHALGMHTIAEFVETPWLRETLEAMGVDCVQGYGVAEPRPLPPPPGAACVGWR